jgi:phage baseplate assembly protein W
LLVVINDSDMIKFPLQIQNKRLTPCKDTNEAIAQSLKVRIATPRGSMFFNGDYGSRVSEALLTPIAPVRIARLSYWLKEAFAQEQRVDVSNVLAVNDAKETEQGRITLMVSYTVRATNKTGNVNIAI